MIEKNVNNMIKFEHYVITKKSNEKNVMDIKRM